MAHNIQSRDIQTGIQIAWHNLTTLVEKIELDGSNSGINYGMETRPLFIRKSDGTMIETGQFQIISLDDELPVGKAVSDSYTLISNMRVWEMVQEAMGGTHHQIVSCGTVDDRSKGFITIKLNDEFRAASRLTEPYFNILWGHGGNIPLIARSSFIVTVCQNTFNLNLGRKGKDLNLSVKHTKNAELKIVDMGKALESYAGVVAEFKLAMDSFEQQDCDTTKAEKIFFGTLAPQTFEKELTVSTRLKNVVNNRLVPLFSTGRGNKGENLADVFNAATDYFTHESSGGNDKMKQFVSSEFGSGQRMKELFFNVLSDEETLEQTINRGEKVALASIQD